jgi:hypothetical protein
MSPARKSSIGGALDARADEDKTSAHTDAAGRRIRVTVELERDSYRDLAQWTAAAVAEGLDVPRLPLAVAIRAMIRVTLTDRDTAAKVRELLLQQTRKA